MTGKRSATARLRRLRSQLMLAVGLLTAVGLGSLALLTTIVDQDLRNDRFGVEQQSLASRASALIFFDYDTNEWDFDGVIDDKVAAEAEVLVITDRSNNELYRQGPPVDVAAFVALAQADAAEVGVVGDIKIADNDASIAGSPYFEDDQVAGTVIVAATLRGDPDHSRLTLLVWSAAAALTALSLAVARYIAGRVLRPMGKSIDREAAFLATAAHELRTPLARAQAVAESTLLTARQLPETEHRTSLVTDVQRLVAVTREASSDLNDLLLVGRIDAAQLQARRETVRLDELVSQFESIIPELAAETTGPVEITADPMLLRHALSNLFINAQRHGRVPGRSLLIQATVQSANGVATICVRDNGPGLTGTSPAEIFNRHHTNGSGTGLGLWIVEQIMSQEGGSVTAIDHAPDGLEFQLRWS